MTVMYELKYSHGYIDKHKKSIRNKIDDNHRHYYRLIILILKTIKLIGVFLSIYKKVNSKQ